MGTIDNNVSQLYDLLNHIPVTKDNAAKIQEIKDANLFAFVLKM